MKYIGVEIDKKKVICVAMEKNTKNEIVIIPNKKKYFEVKDDRNGEELRQFQIEIFEYFDSIKPDEIAILARQTKGRFAASPFSFKLEGILQLYSPTNFQFLSPQSITAFFKKNELPLNYEFSYQEKATKLTYFLAKN